MKKTIVLIFVLVAGFVNNANASWQSYVDDNLVGTGYVAKGAIVGSNGSVWAQSSNLNLVEGEGSAMVAGFSNPENVLSNGLYIEGAKYFAIKVDVESQPQVIYLKKGPISACVAKTTQAVVLGIGNEGQNAALLNNTVEDLANYLIESGY